MTEAEEPKDPEAATPRSGAREPALTGRRAFFAKMAGLVATCVAILYAIPLVRYLLYPSFVAGPANPWSSLGPAKRLAALPAPQSRFVTVKEKDGWLETDSKKAVYITKDDQGRVEVLTAVCPHLGCIVQWKAASHQFQCPCHGSVFAPSGAHVSGPAPRGMDSLPIKVENGNLMVRYEVFRQLLPVKEILD